MKSDAGYYAPGPSNFKELPMVLVLSLCLSVAWVATLTLPFRFAVASLAGMALLAASCFVENKRLFYLTLMTLALVLPTNKRLVQIHSQWPHTVDAIYVTLVDVFLILSYAVWFFSSLRAAPSRRLFQRSLIIPFLGLCAVCLFSFVNSVEPGRGIFELIRMFKTLALYFFLIGNIRDLKEVRWILAFLAAGLLFEFGFCLVEKYGVHGSLGLKYFGESERSVESFVSNQAVFRSGGTLGHPNALAYYLDLLLPLMLTRVFALRSGRWTRRFYFLAFAAACGCLYFAQSRASIVATGISLTLCFLVLAWRNLRLRVFPVQTLAVALVSLAVLGAFHQKIFHRFGKNDAGAFQTRFDQYHVAWRMAKAHPWVGVGLHSYIQASPAYDDTVAKVSTAFPAPVHNMYLLALSETGLVGLAGLAWLLLSIFRMARFWQWPYGEIFDLHLGFFFSLAGFFIHANGEPHAIGVSVPLFFILGLLTVAHRIGAERDSGTKTAAR